MGPTVSINYITVENAAAGHDRSPPWLCGGTVMCPQKNAVLLGGNKTNVCAGLQVTKSKRAQGPNDVEYSNSVLKSTSAVADA